LKGEKIKIFSPFNGLNQTHIKTFEQAHLQNYYNTLFVFDPTANYIFVQFFTSKRGQGAQGPIKMPLISVQLTKSLISTQENDMSKISHSLTPTSNTKLS